jgi:DNA topoisomerase VI subunit B
VTQLGAEPADWPLILLKELIDNALDACEQERGLTPSVEVAVGPGCLAVVDNGPGIPVAVIEKSLDYTVRVSEKMFLVSPTRGQLGNALKCLWAAPFVASGERGVAEVETAGVCHRIEVTLDRINQRPSVQHIRKPSLVKNGTCVRLYWPQEASLPEPSKPFDFYKAGGLVPRFATFNPHAGLALRLENGDGRDCLDFGRPTPGFRKWLPHYPTSAHWYTEDSFRNLVAAELRRVRDSGRVKTVRAFVASFDGLSGSQRQKAVVDAAGLSKATLAELVRGDDIDSAAVGRLLAAMQGQAKPVAPAALGVIGEAHLAESMRSYFGVVGDSVRYRRRLAFADNLPFVVEVAFGVKAGDSERRQVVMGLNWSPALRVPAVALEQLLGAARVDEFDPAVILVHVACPRLEYTERGKGHLLLAPAIREALAAAVATVTKSWKKEKRQADRTDRLHRKALEGLRQAKRRTQLSIKEAAFQVMEAAYLHASNNGTLPANARQIMYAARPRVLELTGGRCWRKSGYFTQRLLPDYLRAHPEQTASWDVVFDARGHFAEPHAARRVPLGTLAVRKYIHDWTGDSALDIPRELPIKRECPTVGPTYRYKFALFVEKEGFDALLDAARIARRFDVAIMSTKGMSVTAARELVDELAARRVRVLVLRDFDKAGFSIVRTLKKSSKRYRYRNHPRVRDLGLRLTDVEEMGLQAEPVTYHTNVSPRRNLRKGGATRAERAFLVLGLRGGVWEGERVELNAMTSPQFVAFLERKLTEAGAKKLVPAPEVLDKAFRRARQLYRAGRAAEAVLREASDTPVPAELRQFVRQRIAGTDTPWDEAVWQLAAEAKDDGPPPQGTPADGQQPPSASHVGDTDPAPG